MDAIRLRQPGQFETVSIPEAAKPGPGEALIGVYRVGICGTDISGFLGKMPFYSYPRIPGHELGVEVLDVGPGVENVRLGDRGSVEPYMNCQQCFSCRRNRPNCCENLQVLGVHTDGGMRPRFIVPARKLHPSAKLTLDQLALVETLAIGCHAVDRGSPQAGDNVLVVGGGPIGLSVIEFVKLTGATITVLDVKPSTSASPQWRPPHDRLTILRRPCRGEGRPQEPVPVVFGATVTQRHVRCVRYALTGRIVFVGIVTDAVSFPDPLFHRRG